MMNASRWRVLAVPLLMLVCTVSGALAGGWREKKEIERDGWQVAYGNELTETDAEQGAVAPGVSIYAERRSSEMEAVHDWADALVTQAEAKMTSSLGPASVRGFGQDEHWQARRLTVRTVRELLRSRQEGVSEILSWGGIECKAGVLKYRDREDGRGRRDQWEAREVILVPYVGLRQTFGAGSQPQRDDRDADQDEGPVQQALPHAGSYDVFPGQHPGQLRHGASSSADVLDALSLTSTARNLRNGRWEWTARIEGSGQHLRRIRSVKYYLHPSFTPNVQYGNSSLPGHPLTATGWGRFMLRAEVSLADGTKRIYEHMLQFR